MPSKAIAGLQHYSIPTVDLGQRRGLSGLPGALTEQGQARQKGRLLGRRLVPLSWMPPKQRSLADAREIPVKPLVA